MRFSSCHSWLSARTWIRPCIFASSMCNSVVRLKGKRSHTAFLATLPFLGVELPLFSRERAPICLRAKESIASPNASAMCVVPEPGESTKKALSPYTIWSSSRLSTSLQNCAFNREGQSKRIIKSVRKARAQTQWNTTIGSHLCKFTGGVMLGRDNTQVDTFAQEGQTSAGSAEKSTIQQIHHHRGQKLQSYVSSSKNKQLPPMQAPCRKLVEFVIRAICGKAPHARFIAHGSACSESLASPSLLTSTTPLQKYRRISPDCHGHSSKMKPLECSKLRNTR